MTADAQDTRERYFACVGCWDLAFAMPPRRGRRAQRRVCCHRLWRRLRPVVMPPSRACFRARRRSRFRSREPPRTSGESPVVCCPVARSSAARRSARRTACAVRPAAAASPPWARRRGRKAARESVAGMVRPSDTSHTDLCGRSRVRSAVLRPTAPSPSAAAARSVAPSRRRRPNLAVPRATWA